MNGALWFDRNDVKIGCEKYARLVVVRLARLIESRIRNPEAAGSHHALRNFFSVVCDFLIVPVSPACRVNYAVESECSCICCPVNLLTDIVLRHDFLKMTNSF